jgi:molybdate transport system substrate-binding protein
VRRAVAAIATIALALTSAGCGDDADSEATAGEGGKPRLVVSAASSMTEALRACGPEFEDATVRLQFAGSDELAAQIRQGVKPDVYAAANTKLPDELNKEGLLSKPVEFATNELVLAVPKDSDIQSIDDLTADDPKIAIGAENVPIGSYTRETLARLPAEEEQAILRNVRSNEPDVKGIVGKLTQGAVDAGFVYVSDVNATGGELEAIELPADLQPTVTYGAGVVEGAKQPEEAQMFVDELVDGPCADALEKAGFGPARR